MMRALAGVSAAAVAVIALPATLGVAAETDTAAAITITPTSSGLTRFLDEPAILGLNMGAFLWLAIAVLAVVVGAIAVGRSQAGVSQPAGAPTFFPVPAANQESKSSGVRSSTITPVSIKGFTVADISRAGR